MADINSRFICKGPIHKLLNQLATKFEILNSSKPTAGSQSVKRNKGQMGPTFILNLSCPRSYYDIVASEQSRTSVEFKVVSPCAFKVLKFHISAVLSRNCKKHIIKL